MCLFLYCILTFDDISFLYAINDVTFYLEKEAFLDMSLAIIECQASCYATYDSFKVPKGHLISKCPFGVIVLTKIPTKCF